MAKDQEQQPNSTGPGKKSNDIPIENPPKGLRRVLVEGGIAGCAVVLILVWLAGGFHGKVKPGTVEVPGREIPADGTRATVRQYTLPRYEWAIGSIQAVHETALGSKILAKVLETNITAGQKVHEGQVLMTLDNADLKSKEEQAESAVEIAKANLAQAQDDYERVMKLAKDKAAAAQEINQVENTLKGAKARLDVSNHALEEAKTVLTYAVIKSPFSGLVIDKKTEAGDMVVPGQILLRLYDPRRMQLVANVRESLAANLKIGEPLQVFIPAMSKFCCGTVTEIVPQAQAASRGFDVKVVGPCAPGVYTGMFGRLMIPLGTEEVILIPQAMVVYVGQLNLVEVAEDHRLLKRSIQIGRTFEDFIEVLSGLSPGEKIWTPKKITLSEKREILPTYLWQGLPIKGICPTTQGK
jgi:RND family efflux transporter MFP subunit